MKQIVLITIVVLMLSSVYAGRYAGDFMAIGAGVRALGMGGAFAAVANDGSAGYWNPAGLGFIRNSQAAAMHAFMYNGLAAYNNITYAQPLPNDVTIGVGLTSLTVTDIPRFDEEYLIGTNVDQRINDSAYHLPGIPDGYFDSADNLYQFSFSKAIHFNANMGWLFFEVPFDMAFGGNVKYIKRRIMNSEGSGTGLDFGVMVKTDMAVLFDVEELGDITFGANFQDISGTNITWDTETSHSDEALFNTKIGLAIKQPIPAWKSDLVLAYDYDYVYEGTRHFGLEWNYDSKAAFRLGYYNKNYSCGASVRVFGINLDYALITNPVGVSNRLGLRVEF